MPGRIPPVVWIETFLSSLIFPNLLVLRLEKPVFVLAEGNTSSALAASMAASKLGIKVGHIQAGLRSNSRETPEAVNRIAVDRCSDYLLAPSERARKSLLAEGFPENSIFVTGNTIVDAIGQNLEIARNGAIMPIPGPKLGKYFLAAINRRENLDSPKRLRSILLGLNELIKMHEIPVIWPAAPLSVKRISQFGLDSGRLQIVQPLDYLSFLHMEKHARLILTDSGSIQEEGCVLGVPCVTLCRDTETPETLDVGANILAGADMGRIIECTQIMLEHGETWQNPLGDGRAAEKIVAVISGITVAGTPLVTAGKG